MMLYWVILEEKEAKGAKVGGPFPHPILLIFTAKGI